MKKAPFTTRLEPPPSCRTRRSRGRRRYAIPPTPFLWLPSGVFDIEDDMGTSESDSTAVSPQDGRFPSTHWSMVMSAGKDSSPDAREAFGRLYRAYLPPLLAFLRREGRSQPEAEDLAQGFFEFLLEKRSLGRVRPDGKFRSWLLVSLRNYLSDVWDKARAIKRGGNQPHLALARDEGETKLELPASGRTPEEEYDHEFALRFLDLVMGLLQQEYQDGGKAHIFEGLRPLLLDKKGATSHAERGQPLGMSANAVTTEVSRMRKRYREIFDRELEKLLGGGDELEPEKRFLFASLSK